VPAIVIDEMIIIELNITDLGEVIKQRIRRLWNKHRIIDITEQFKNM